MHSEQKLSPLSAAVVLGITFFALPGCASLDASWREVKADVGGFFRSDRGVDSKDEQANAQAAYERALMRRAAGDHAAAVKDFRQAAKLGHARAAYELGIAYLSGQGVRKDLEESAAWINRAADLGDASAQFLVGSSLYAGVGVPQDAPRGLMLLERSAEQGHLRAQFVLGQAYVDGKGVSQNPTWAARWYGKAARGGHTEAQYAYGAMLASGLGLPKNSRHAYKWLRLAAESGNEQAAQLAESVRRRLTPEQIAATEKSVSSFSPAPSAGYMDPPTVMYVQQRLNALGYKAGPVDGVPGPRTRAAIETYQTEHRLSADGVSSRELVESLHNNGAT